jgi:hypothetical protein
MRFSWYGARFVSLAFEVFSSVSKNTTRAFLERSRLWQSLAKRNIEDQLCRAAHAQRLPRTRISTKNRTQKWERALVVSLIALLVLVSFRIIDPHHRVFAPPSAGPAMSDDEFRQCGRKLCDLSADRWLPTIIDADNIDGASISSIEICDIFCFLYI